MNKYQVLYERKIYGIKEVEAPSTEEAIRAANEESYFEAGSEEIEDSTLERFKVESFGFRLAGIKRVEEFEYQEANE